MQTPMISEPRALQQAFADARAAAKRVALVPTMGALHEGHLVLVREALARADWVAVSVFVNPTQFGPHEDFARYPRTLQSDRAALDGLALAPGQQLVLFAPPGDSMYSAGDATRVQVEPLTRTLCGPLRPGHFTGVATVVSKLFALLGEGIALFGRKDYQQLQVLRRVVRDLFFPVEIIGVPTVREADGLAMSSRNRYLNEEQRQRARALSRALAAVQRAHARGERSFAALTALLHQALVPVDLVEYASLYDADDLHELKDDGAVGERALVAIAAKVGQSRLIDNLVLGEDAELMVPA